jgi:hypothetical protein
MAKVVWRSGLPEQAQPSGEQREDGDRDAK